MLYAGTEIIVFSPTEELQQTLDVVTKTWKPRLRIVGGTAAVEAQSG